jgi:hypothetical protein
MAQKINPMNPMAQRPVPALRTPVEHAQGSPTGKIAYHPNKSPTVPNMAPVVPNGEQYV